MNMWTYVCVCVYLWFSFTSLRSGRVWRWWWFDRRSHRTSSEVPTTICTNLSTLPRGGGSPNTHPHTHVQHTYSDYFIDHHTFHTLTQSTPHTFRTLTHHTSSQEQLVRILHNRLTSFIVNFPLKVHTHTLPPHTLTLLQNKIFV